MASRTRPSSRWTSFESWRYDGMDKRLEDFMQLIQKSALVDHVRSITNDDSISISEPFAAGQFWCCFELVSAKTDQLLIARVRLPKHPDSASGVSEQSETYGIMCEVATMRFLQANVKTALCPRLFAYEGSDSSWVKKVGASYMIIEGFYGNTLQDIQYDICNLPSETQEHIIRQWTAVQVELAAHTFPQIGSLCEYTHNGVATIGPLAVAAAENFEVSGPFDDAYEYFIALADARIRQECEQDSQQMGNDHERSANESENSSNGVKTGLFIFKDIVESTELFKPIDRAGPFSLKHMDLGTQNILVDDDFNFLAVIDWEFAQTAPWEVHHFPMPFPMLSSESKIAEILADPKHIAYRNTLRQTQAQKLYEQGFFQAEENAAARRSALGRSISETLTSPAARIVGLMEKVGVFSGMEEELTLEMIRLAYGLQGNDATTYVAKIRRTFSRGCS